MNRLPCLIRLKIYSPQHHINLWLPLFLAWLLLAALLIALSPLLLILAVILWFMGWEEYLFALGPAFYRCLCALNGLEVDVNNKNGEKVFISFQ